MPSFLENIGLGAAGTAANEGVGAILGMALEHHNDKRQINQQQKLTDIQLRANERMAQTNSQLQYDLWKKTNYPAQVEMLKEAGLNPGLLYGMGGSGGGSTASPGGSGVNGSQAPSGGGEIYAMTNQAMQMQLLKAQTENIQADTANKQAEHPNISIAGQEALTRIENLKQQTQNAKANETLTKIQTELATIDKDYQNATLEDRVNNIALSVQRSITELENAQNQTWINTETSYNVIEIIRQEALSKFIENTIAQTNQQAAQIDIQKTRAEINKFSQEIAQEWKSLSIAEFNSKINAFNAEMKAAYPSLWEVAGRQINDGIEKLFNVMHGEKREPVQKIH